MTKRKATSDRLAVRITPRGKEHTHRKRVSKRELQPPFREQDLLVVSRFIDHCKHHGITTDKSELEYFEKDVILLPAIRVRYGVFENPARGKAKRYSPGALHMGERGWVSDYIKMGLVDYPARTSFRPWSEYDLPPTAYSSTPDVFSRACEIFYTRFQMYLIPLIQMRRTLEVKNEMLFKPPEDWARLGENASRWFDREKTGEFLRLKVLDYYRLCRCLFDIERLWGIWTDHLSREYAALVKKHKGNLRDVESDIREEEALLSDRLRRRAKLALTRHKMSERELDGWRFTILALGTFGVVSPVRRDYLKFLEDEALAEIEDPYRLVFLLNWFIGICGGKPSSIRELLLKRSEYRYCPYCGSAFLPRRVDQKTCGSNECKRASSRDWKRAKRESGQYPY